MATGTAALIEEFIARTRALDGKEVREREAWNNEASPDAIRHFACGTDDDNPLWLDPAYAARTPHGGLLAPPAFLVSVLYPILHGAPMVAPLSSLIGGVEFEWRRRVKAGDRLRASSVQKASYAKTNKAGRKLIFVISECTYRNQADEAVATAAGTMIRTLQEGTELLYERPIKKYSEEEMAKIAAAYKGERRTGSATLFFEDVREGQALPPMVRGPLTIGDMVAWNAGNGPSYKAGRRGYLDLEKAPHNAVPIPQIGIRVKNSQQHEDFHLAAQRGMPGPFDNGVMRFAWVSPFVTNWMGDEGFLKKLYVQVRRPMIYGDTLWYSGKVTAKDAASRTVSVEITGVNQEGEVATAGSAVVELPARGR
ncbi:MAG: MaoC family dehydratase N-terminal domain-containing protein [Nitrospinota bacterium]